jgi:hypothetical protein
MPTKNNALANTDRQRERRKDRQTKKERKTERQKDRKEEKEKQRKTCLFIFTLIVVYYFTNIIFLFKHLRNLH